MPVPTKEQPAGQSAAGSVRVEIFDHAYNLRGSDADYILKLAAYVDAKMRAVAEQTHTVDSLRIAVLAAINVADELHLLKARLEDGSSDYLKRAHHLASALDEVLQDRRAG
jgi:cell division protein ZapA